MYRYNNDYLMHYGVKGMKWGVRHDPVKEVKKRYKSGYTDDEIREKRKQLINQAPKSDGTRRSTSAPPTKGYWKNASRSQIARLMYSEELKNAKAQKKARKRFSKEWHKSYNKATYQFNSKIDDINKRHTGPTGDNFETKAGQKYVKEVNKMWQTEYKKAIMEDYGDQGELFINDAPFMDQYVDFIKKK